MKHINLAQILSPRSNLAPRPMVGILLFASIVVVANSLVAAPQPEELLAENSGTLPGSAESTASARADPGYWIRRARKAAERMREKIADEKTIFLSLVSRAMAENGQVREATELALSSEPSNRLSALLSIAAIRARAQDSEGVQESLQLVNRELASMKQNDPETYEMEAVSWICNMVGVQCELGDIGAAIKTVNLIPPELDQGGLHFTGAGPIETPPGCNKSNALVDIAMNQARLGDLGGARTTALSIPLRETREAAMWLIAHVLAGEGDHESAQRLVKPLDLTRIKDRKVFVFDDGQPLEIPVSRLASNALATIAEGRANAGDLAAADAVIKSIPNENARMEALQGLAGVQCGAGRFSEAKEIARGLPSRASRERILVDIGIAQAKQGDLPGAKVTVNEITAKEFQALIYGTMGEYLLEAGEEDRAADMFKTADRLVANKEIPVQLSLLLRIASVYFSRGQREAGHARIERALQLCENIEDEGARDQSFRRIVDHQYKFEEFAEGKRILARVNDGSKKVQTVVLLGIHEYMAGNKEEARETLREAFQMALAIDLLVWIEDPRSKAAIIRTLGSELAKMGEMELISQLGEGAKTDHSRASAYLFLGAAEGLIETRPESLDAYDYTTRGESFASKGEYDKALADYDEALRIDPKFSPAYYERALVWELKGDLEKAVTDISNAIEIDPENAWYLSARGRLWNVQGEYNKAIADLDKAIRLDPELGMAYYSRGVSRSMKGDHEKALLDYGEALRLDPANAMAYCDRATIRTLKGDIGKAIADLEKAVALDPDNPNYLNRRAWLRATSENASWRDGRKAVADATKACELTDWKRPDYLDTLAAAHAETEAFDEAVRWQEKAMELASPDMAARFSTRLELYKVRKPYREKYGE